MINRKKIQMGYVLYSTIRSIGMDKPENFDSILDFIYDDVCETADEENWNDSDIIIGFRRWIEAQQKEVIDTWWEVCTIDEEYGSETIASFDTRAEALEFISDRKLKYPDVELGYDEWIMKDGQNVKVN